MSFVPSRVGLRRVRKVLPRRAASAEGSSSLVSFTWSTSRPASSSSFPQQADRRFPSRPSSPLNPVVFPPKRVWGSPEPWSGGEGRNDFQLMLCLQPFICIKIPSKAGVVMHQYMFSFLNFFICVMQCYKNTLIIRVPKQLRKFISKEVVKA